MIMNITRTPEHEIFFYLNWIQSDTFLVIFILQNSIKKYK